MRHSNSTTAYFAATKSREIYNDMETYSSNSKLNNVKKNHCTKFVWQSYYQSLGKDAFGWGLTDSMSSLILPVSFNTNSKKLSNVGSY